MVDFTAKVAPLYAQTTANLHLVQGRASNGRVDWKTKDGRTLKDLQDAEVKE